MYWKVTLNSHIIGFCPQTQKLILIFHKAVPQQLLSGSIITGLWSLVLSRMLFSFHLLQKQSRLGAARDRKKGCHTLISWKEKSNIGKIRKFFELQIRFEIKPFEFQIGRFNYWPTKGSIGSWVEIHLYSDLLESSDGNVSLGFPFIIFSL